MPAFRIARLTRARNLQAIEPTTLITFLTPYAEYFADREFPLPEPPETFSGEWYLGLQHLLLTPDVDTPQDLIDALHLINDLTNPESAAQLVGDFEEAGITLDLPEECPEVELVMRAYLRAPRILEQRHARDTNLKAQKFEHFLPTQPGAKLLELTEQRLRQVEERLDRYFVTMRRGTGARVLPFPQPGETHFLIRHGKLFERTESLVEGEVVTVSYRPLTYDIVVYNHRRGDLRINAELRGEFGVYREAFGEFLFSEGTKFEPAACFILEPLRRGAEAITCADQEEIDEVKLLKVDLALQGDHALTTSWSGEDVFAALEEIGEALPQTLPFQAAQLRVQFCDARTQEVKSRTVWLYRGNVSKYQRDEASPLLEEWLEERGFLLTQQTILQREAA